MGGGDYCHILIKDENLEEQIAKFEKENGYQSLLKDIHQPYYLWEILSFYENTVRKEGFYYEEVGDARGGMMNTDFWARFCSSEIYNYALEDDFQFAFTCCTESCFEGEKEEFKNDFVDQFELGTSFLSVSG